MLTLQDRLTSLNAEKWANEDWQRYQELSEAGDDTFLANDFAAAVRNYEGARSLGDEIVARAAAAVERSFGTGEAALAAGNAELAIEQYDLVLTIEPTHAQALAQRERAQRLPDVLTLVQRADGERSRGELDAALASYREALALDPSWAPANAAIDDIHRELRDAEFERLLSGAFGVLGDEDFAEAQTRFKAALAVRPGLARSAGRAQASRARREARADRACGSARPRIRAARAVGAGDRPLSLGARVRRDATVRADGARARSKLARGSTRSSTNLVDNPSLLLTDTVLTDARKLVDEVAAQELHGPRIDGQVEQLGRLITLASQPIAVRLTSDQLTTVTLYRVGSLGAFAARDVELRPGTYTVIGSRDGYRDVRQTFTVRPGGNLAPISVVCVEPI